MKRSFPLNSFCPRPCLSVWFLFSFACGLCWNAPATAQVKPKQLNPLEPQVSLVQSSIDRLITDLESAMSLTSPEEQKQTGKIKDYLDLTFKGMDYQRLMRMDFIAGDGPLRYRPAFPIEDMKVYWTENLRPNHFNTRRKSAEIYEVQGAFEGYLRMRNKYAIFGEKLEDLPGAAPPPDEPKIQDLLDLTKDTAMKMENIGTPQAVAFRRNSYHDAKLGLRQELAKQIKKTKSETQNAYDIRKLTAEHQLDHFERFYVDAENWLVLGHHDLEKKTLAFDVNVLPIPQTPLAEHVQSLNQEPLSFANIPKAAKSNMSLRVRMPLDEMHQKHMTETFDLFKRIAHEDVDENKEKSADQKEATEEVIDLTYKLLLDTVKSGLADGFFEAHPNPDETNTAVAAFKAVDGNAPLEILKLLEKTREGQKVTMNLSEEGGVAIHSFLISEEQHPGYRKFFGSAEMYVGTSKDTIWLAAGLNAVAEMKTAIGLAAKPNTGKAGDPFLTMSGRVAPWMKFHASNYPKAGSEMFQKYRRLIIEAGEPGDDHFDMWFNRNGNEIKGNMTGQPGWARFIGKYLADFALNNIEEV